MLGPRTQVLGTHIPTNRSVCSSLCTAERLLQQSPKDAPLPIAPPSLLPSYLKQVLFYW